MSFASVCATTPGVSMLAKRLFHCAETLLLSDCPVSERVVRNVMSMVAKRLFHCVETSLLPSDIIVDGMNERMKKKNCDEATWLTNVNRYCHMGVCHTADPIWHTGAYSP